MRRSEYIEVTLDADRPGDGNSEPSAKTVSEYGGVARRCVGSEREGKKQGWPDGLGLEGM